MCKNLIVWEGKSLLDGKNIAVIATGIQDKSCNSKTGNMVQCYILRKDIHPLLARYAHEDKSICGDCKHRFHNTCYVIIGQAPTNIFSSFHENKYKKMEQSDLAVFENRIVRFGAYGDPAAVPYEVWEEIAKRAKGYTGYTHQWKTCDQRLKNICMASVDSIDDYMDEYNKAKEIGWRTFRAFATNKKNESVFSFRQDGEIVCPASKEAGKTTTCEECNLCCGTSKATGKDVMIMVHGGNELNGFWQNTKFYKLMKRIKNKKKWKTDIDFDKIKKFFAK